MWATLKRKVYERGPKTKNEIIKIAQEEWEKIPRKNIQKLFDHMPNRIKAVMKSRGNPTKY